MLPDDDDVEQDDTSDAALTTKIFRIFCPFSSIKFHAVKDQIIFHSTLGGPLVPFDCVDGGGWGGAGALFFLATGLFAGGATAPLDVVEIVLRRGGGPLVEVGVVDASVDIWLNIKRLFRLATASSASLLENRTGDGGLGATGSTGGGGGTGSSDRDGEILRSPTLSLLILLSPIL